MNPPRHYYQQITRSYLMNNRRKVYFAALRLSICGVYHGLTNLGIICKNPPKNRREYFHIGEACAVCSCLKCLAWRKVHSIYSLHLTDCCLNCACEYCRHLAKAHLHNKSNPNVLRWFIAS
jgi:hypothetical protein